MAENAVKRAKNLLRRCAAAKDDPQRGLLALRNTPTEGRLYSPVQRLFGRATRTDIPRVAGDHFPNSSLDIRTHHDPRPQRQQYPEPSGKDLPPLLLGQPVRMQPCGGGQETWRRALVVDHPSPRRYVVQTSSGQQLLRNRRFLRTSHEEKCSDSHPGNGSQPPGSKAKTAPCLSGSPGAGDGEVEVELKRPAMNSPGVPPGTPPTCRTRSGRVSKPVVKLNL